MVGKKFITNSSASAGVTLGAVSQLVNLIVNILTVLEGWRRFLYFIDFNHAVRQKPNTNGESILTLNKLNDIEIY